MNAKCLYAGVHFVNIDWILSIGITVNNILFGSIVNYKNKFTVVTFIYRPMFTIVTAGTQILISCYSFCAKSRRINKRFVFRTAQYTFHISPTKPGSYIRVL